METGRAQKQKKKKENRNKPNEIGQFNFFLSAQPDPLIKAKQFKK
jgi:hypothetical protein